MAILKGFSSILTVALNDGKKHYVTYPSAVYLIWSFFMVLLILGERYSRVISAIVLLPFEYFRKIETRKAFSNDIFDEIEEINIETKKTKELKQKNYIALRKNLSKQLPY